MMPNREYRHLSALYAALIGLELENHGVTATDQEMAHHIDRAIGSYRDGHSAIDILSTVHALGNEIVETPVLWTTAVSSACVCQWSPHVEGRGYQLLKKNPVCVVHRMPRLTL